MEFAIPLAALGGLFLVSKQKKQTSETFDTREALPNTNLPDVNYPDMFKVNSVELDRTAEITHNNRYDGGEAFTDKYFNPTSKGSVNQMPAMSSAAASSGQTFTSLTGQQVDGEYFRHNNMVPFFGSKIHSTFEETPNKSEAIMDNYLGGGSQVISKKEQSPLFRPDENVNWAYGAPNQSDFYQSRVNPSMRMANVKPFLEEKVAPGLGLGYGTEGGAGFNSGMLAREAWMPKTVDQLRVDSHQKAGGQMLLGHEGPAMSYVTQLGSIGTVEKNRPERTFETGQERYLTTTGLEKAPTMRSINVERNVNRPETSVEYMGGGGYHNTNMYVDGEYMESKHQDLGPIPFGIANSEGQGGAMEADYGVKTKFAYPNNRSSNKQPDYYGTVGGVFGAAVAPLMDVLRPSRRENVIGTLRPYQNPATRVALPYVFNPADRPGTTIRETTENSKFHLNVNKNQNGGAYAITENQAVFTERMNQSDYYYAGNSSAGSNNREPRTYDAEYRQRNNNIKSSTIDGRLVPGNMSLMNGDMNITSKAKDGYLTNNRAVAPSMPAMPPSYDTMGKLQGKSGLYQSSNLDRTNPELMTALKGNPYALNVLGGL